MELNVRRLGDVGDDLLLVGVDLGIGRLGELRLALQSLIQKRRFGSSGAPMLPIQVSGLFMGRASSMNRCLSSRLASRPAKLLRGEVTVHLLQKRMPAGVALAEVAIGSRTALAPERFKMTTSVGGLPHWQLRPHLQRFEK